MSEETTVGRNEPCPCGSGKKYKRCCGVNAAPKVTPPAAMPSGEGMPAGLPPGFDPSQLDPQMMAQMSQMLQRLPRGQMQRLQSIMQRAMSGKDVSREAADFEKMLPPDMKAMMQTMAGNFAPGAGGESAETPEAEMSVEEAKKIVEAAAASGKISADEASDLLKAQPSEEKSSKVSKLWKNLRGKS